MKKNQNGFGVVEILVIVLIIGVMGGLGMVAYAHFHVNTPKTASSNTISDKNIQPTAQHPAASNVRKLANVTYKMPDKWYVDDHANNYYSHIKNYVAGTVLLPGAKLATTEGNSTEYFHVYIEEFSNPDRVAPDVWFSGPSDSGQGLAQGLMMEGDTESHDSINGYTSYYRHINHGGYQEIHYVIASGTTIAYVYARTFETHASPSGTGDFLQYEIPISQMVHTISIE